MSATPCSHHYHEFIGRVFVTVYCCKCFEFEDRRRHEAPSRHFRDVEIWTRNYSFIPSRLRGIHEQYRL